MAEIQGPVAGVHGVPGRVMGWRWAQEGGLQGNTCTESIQRGHPRLSMIEIILYLVPSWG